MRALFPMMLVVLPLVLAAGCDGLYDATYRVANHSSYTLRVTVDQCPKSEFPEGPQHDDCETGWAPPVQRVLSSGAEDEFTSTSGMGRTTPGVEHVLGGVRAEAMTTGQLVPAYVQEPIDPQVWMHARDVPQCRAKGCDLFTLVLADDDLHL